MKKIFILLLTVCMLLSVLPTMALAADDEGTVSFAVDPAKAKTFADVPVDAWYGDNKEASIKTATELGIMAGDTDGLFRPDAELKLSEAIKMAAVVCSTYLGDGTQFVQGEPWYGVYVDYAVEKGMIKADEFVDYSAACTRAQAAYIFAGALPESALDAVSELTPPDVAADVQYAGQILALYRAGILQGNDDIGTFGGEGYFTRAQAAAIISRLCLGAGAYQTGVTVVKAEKADEAGEHGASYKAAGFKATFVYVNSDEKVASVSVGGSLGFYNDTDSAEYSAAGYPNGNSVAARSAYEYEKGMYPTSNGVAYDMTEIAEGVYSISIPMPTNVLYDYRFTVTYEDGTSQKGSKSEFTVGTAADAVEELKNFYPVAPEDQGSYEYATITASSGIGQNLRIYLPNDYDESRTYKVLYVAHGSNANENQWFNGGCLGNIMDNLTRDGVIEDTIVVGMDNKTPFGNLSSNEDLVAAAKNLAEVIVPYMEENYPISNEVKDRAVFGLSAGGSFATNVLQTVPDAFGYLGISSVGRAFPFDAATASQEDMAAVKVAIYSGTMDHRTPASEVIRNDLDAFSDNVMPYKVFNGAHDMFVWRAVIQDFIINVLWK